MTQMVAELTRDEGTGPQAGNGMLLVYDDATGAALTSGDSIQGHPTIGIGRALDVKGISVDEAEALLAADIREYLMELRPLPWFAGMDPGRQRAIVNMRHQLGLAGLLGFHNMIAAITALNWAAAYAAGAQSRWAATETPARAARVLKLLLLGDMVA